MKPYSALIALVACLASPPVAAQVFSWDPLKDVENALPAGVPNESKIMQARVQVREMAQDSLATLYEVAPNARRAVEQAARRAKAWWSTTAPTGRRS